MNPPQPPARTWYAVVAPVVMLCLVVLAGCSSHESSTAGGLVPWTDEPAAAAQLAQSTTSPTCKVSVLHLPRGEQRWGGAWNNAISGYFMIENSGRTPCALPRPSRVTATTESGTRIGFDVRSLAAPAVVLGPGDRVQVQVSSPYDCGKSLARSTSFALTFPTGTLQVPGARMGVQCGGTLLDFSARDVGASAGGATSTTPAAGLRATMSRVPGSVSPGDSVTYAVTLTNPTSTAISLDPCPSYQEGIKGQRSSVHTYQLNCGAVGQIAAHSSVSFAMQLPLPDHVTPGAAVLNWELQLPSGSVDQGQFASAGTTVN